jgi:hypothetical protein
VFLATDDAFEPFTTVELEIELPGDRVAALSARVAHIVSGELVRRRGTQIGVGLQFEGLSQAQRAEVVELVARARAEDNRMRVPRPANARRELEAAKRLEPTGQSASEPDRSPGFMRRFFG